MFWYQYYDYLIKSNIQLYNFELATDYSNHKVVQVYYIELDPKNHVRNSQYNYISYDDVIFELIIDKRTINIISLDERCFQEVIRNKPFGYFCYLDNRIVLHASAIEYQNKIYAFCGSKGAGKTTMALYLSDKYKLFTDDQLCLTIQEHNLIAISPDNIQKVTEHTADILSIKNNCGEFNGHYKKYMHHSINYTDEKVGQLNAIFMLKRNDCNDTYIEKICDSTHKISLIVSNLVGLSCCKREIFNSKIVDEISKVNMFYLHYSNFDTELCNKDQIHKNIDDLLREVLI